MHAAGTAVGTDAEFPQAHVNSARVYLAGMRGVVDAVPALYLLTHSLSALPQSSRRM